MTGSLLPALALTPLLPALGAAVAACSVRRSMRPVIAGTVGAVLAAVGTLVLVLRSPDDARRGLWAGGDGALAIGLTADRVGATIALLTVAVGLVVVAAGARMFEGDPRARRFGALAGVLIGAVSLVALGATLLTVVAGWLLSGVAVLGLLRLGGQRGADAVRRTATAFAIGDLALLAGAALTLATVGALDLRGDAGAVALAGERIGGLAVTDLVAVLLVVAGMCRAALVPVTRWLPATVAAPTPVSALLHAGVVNGVGVLVLRTVPVTTASEVAMWLLLATGAATAAAATAVMLVRTDAKGALAWSTAGQMGFMAVQLAVGALASALFHLVGHAMYKAAMFLHVGATVGARIDQRHLPVPGRTLGRAPRAMVAFGVTGAATATALAVVAPDLSPAAAMLVVGFGWWSSARLVDGWLGATERRALTITIGIGLGVALPALYVGAMAAFKAFVNGSVPLDPAGAVPAPVLAALLLAAGAGALAVRVLPGAAGRAVRRRAYAVAVGLGSPPVPAAALRPEVPAPAGRPEREPVPTLVPAS